MTPHLINFLKNALETKLYYLLDAKCIILRSTNSVAGLLLQLEKWNEHLILHFPVPNNSKNQSIAGMDTVGNQT